MSLVYKDLVGDSSASVGTADFTLSGARAGYQGIVAAIGDTNTCYYTARNQSVPSEWEVGLGTLSSGVLQRTTILASSESGSKVTFSAGTKNIDNVFPASIISRLDVITTRGDLVRGGVSGVPERVAIGAAGKIMRSDGTDAVWGDKLTPVTVVNLTNQSAVDFTGIPAGVNEIIVTISFSTNGTSLPIIQLGTSSGPTTSGYVGASANVLNAGATTCANHSTGVAIAGAVAASSAIHGSIRFNRVEGGNSWCYSGNLGFSSAAAAVIVGGYVPLAAELDRLRLTTAGGTDQFDAGFVGISY